MVFFDTGVIWGAYYLQWETGNSDWKIQWFAPSRLEEDSFFHSLVSLWRVNLTLIACLKLTIPDLLILLLCQQLSWASDMRESLIIAETPKDVNSSKQLIQEHEEKWEDIQTHNDR